MLRPNRVTSFHFLTFQQQLLARYQGKPSSAEYLRSYIALITLQTHVKTVIGFLLTNRAPGQGLDGRDRALT